MPLDNMSELKRRVPGGKYALARAISERARQLQGGATPLVEVRTPNPLSVAIDEIVAGKVTFIIDTFETITVKEVPADVSGEPLDVTATDVVEASAIAAGNAAAGGDPAEKAL